ncbi:bromodomain-containing protein, putative [Eimeria tenella]|uniref:Bromodomain-containing protein, putative n=1 Tax=Eimeria tenella TaxID=5802 RepID=U6KX36_EIMTE|nr:bromodomain-containing protein, putative [Eimeria tenella]CDJ41483.1 bromodomain-containing protein, putative [Eimeria tenella]|eukprot:XP_013232233.1 bromodomain-containing protein, putative [Eimeria tenella]
MSGGVSLREQHVDASVDFATHSVLGFTSLSLEISGSLVAAAAAAADAFAAAAADPAEAAGAAAAAGETAGEAFRVPFAIPLQLPPCCRIFGCWVDKTPAVFQLGFEGAQQHEDDQQQQQQQQQQEAGPKCIRLDLLAWREALRSKRDESPRPLVYIHLPASVQQTLLSRQRQSAVKHKVKLSISFLLSGLTYGCGSSLFFSQQQYRDSKGRLQQQLLLQTLQGALPCPPWFPTLPCSAYGGAAAAAAGGDAAAAAPADSALHSNWKTVVDVPEGCCAVMPGVLTRRFAAAAAKLRPLAAATTEATAARRRVAAAAGTPAAAGARTPAVAAAPAAAASAGAPAAAPAAEAPAAAPAAKAPSAAPAPLAATDASSAAAAGDLATVAAGDPAAAAARDPAAAAAGDPAAAAAGDPASAEATAAAVPDSRAAAMAAPSTEFKGAVGQQREGIPVAADDAAGAAASVAAAAAAAPLQCCADCAEGTADSCCCVFGRGAPLELLLQQPLQWQQQLPPDSIWTQLLQQPEQQQQQQQIKHEDDMMQCEQPQDQEGQQQQQQQHEECMREVFVFEALSSQRKAGRSGGKAPAAAAAAAAAQQQQQLLLHQQLQQDTAGAVSSGFMGVDGSLPAGGGAAAAAATGATEPVRSVLAWLLPYQLLLFAGRFAAVSGNSGVPYPVTAASIRSPGSRLQQQQHEGAAGAADGEAAAPIVTLITLKGLEPLLGPTTAALAECLRVLGEAFGCSPPFGCLCLLFFPLRLAASGAWGLYSSSALSAALHATSSDASSLGLRELTEEACADCAIGEEVNRCFVPEYSVSGNLAVLPLECLHSSLECKSLGLSSRLLQAESICHLWLEAFYPLSRLTAEAELLGCMYTSTMLRKLLVDLFIEANFGSVEMRIRRFERLQRYVSLCELGLEEFPIDPVGALANSSSSSSGGNDSDGSSNSPSQQQQQQRLLPPVESLAYSEMFQLKCCVVLHALEAYFASQPFLSSRFFRAFCLSDFLAKTSRRRDPPNSERFWRRLLLAATAAYVAHWNKTPQARAAGRALLRLRPDAKQKGGLQAVELETAGPDEQLNPQEHEALAAVEETLQLFRSAFVGGTGCPQLSLSFMVQLQRKGSAMDIFTFELDLLALQPPPPITEPFETHRLQQQQQQQRQWQQEIQLRRPHVEKAGISVFYPADLAGLAGFNLWQAQETGSSQRGEVTLRLSAEGPGGPPASSWESLLVRQLWPALRRPSSAAAASSNSSSNSSSSSSSSGSLLFGGEFSSEMLPLSTHVREKLQIYQGLHDPVDVVGRDGNFILGFGYVGDIPAPLNAGRGPLWQAIKEAQRRHCMQQQQQQQQHPEEDPNEQNVDSFAAVCVDNERTPPSVPVATVGGLPAWARLLQQRDYLLRLRAASGSDVWLKSVGVYIHSVAPAAVPASLVAELLPMAADAFGLNGCLPSPNSSSNSSSSSCCRVLGGGVLQYTGAEVSVPAAPVQQQLLSLQHPSAYLCLSAGFEKYWLPALQLQVVDDDLIRGSNIQLKEGALPLRFALDARAERGRKKVAMKGDRMLHGSNSSKVLMKAAAAAAAATDAPAAAAAAAAAAAQAAATADGPEPAAARAATGGMTAGERITFAGSLSSSDRALFESLKRCVLQRHPSLLSLDNRSLVAKVNSKTKLPILWMRADPHQTWPARIRRCQSGSMWEQQLLSETSVASQLEAAAALGSLLPAQTQGGLLGDDPVKAHAVQALSKVLASHRWHPFFRIRAAFALSRLHNTGGEESAAAWKALANYISSFHSDAVLEAESNEGVSPPEAAEGGSSGDWGGAPTAASAAAAAAAAAGANVPSAPAEGRGGPAEALRLSDYACTSPESRFLRLFYGAVSLIRDPKGLSTPAAIDMLLQPLQQMEATGAADSATLLSLGASVLDCLGNLRWPYTPLPSLAEAYHPYFAAAKAGFRLALSAADRGSKGGPLGSSFGHCAVAVGAPCGCTCELMLRDLAAGTAAAATAAAAAAEEEAAAEAAAKWEAFVFANCRGIENAWTEAWRLFRLDAVKALASPRKVGPGSFSFAASPRQRQLAVAAAAAAATAVLLLPVLVVLLQRCCVAVSAPFAVAAAAASQSAMLLLLLLLLLQEMTCGFLRAMSRNPLLRDLARRRFLGGPLGAPPGVPGALSSSLQPEGPPSLNSVARIVQLFAVGPHLPQEFGVPFDLLHFVASPSHRSLLEAAAPAAAEALLAYDYPLVRRKLCC